MRYAIPVNDGILSPHFGHCAQFALFDVDESSKKITAKTMVDSPGHTPGVLPGWLAEQGASAIIAGGMGSRAVALFDENNIQVIMGAPQMRAEDVLMQYLQGTLKLGENVCDH
jgi:predicted Fe-Mo cluster-binding NifX family protein